MTYFLTPAILAAGIISSAIPAFGQDRSSWGAKAGFVNYEARFTGQGQGLTAGVSRTKPLGQYIVLEGSLPLFLSTGERLEDDIVHQGIIALLPDLQIHAQWPDATLRPYLGVGLGAAIPLSESGFTFGPSASASLGARMNVGRIILSIEARARRIRTESEFAKERTREIVLGLASR